LTHKEELRQNKEELRQIKEELRQNKEELRQNKEELRQNKEDYTRTGSLLWLVLFDFLLHRRQALRTQTRP
jgi:hypothetical protein